MDGNKREGGKNPITTTFRVAVHYGKIRLNSEETWKQTSLYCPYCGKQCMWSSVDVYRRASDPLYHLCEACGRWFETNEDSDQGTPERLTALRAATSSNID